MYGLPRRAFGLSVLLVMLATAAHVADAQDAGHATPLLAPDHWAVRAAFRAEALGLVEFHPAQRAVPVIQVAEALGTAARGAEGRLAAPAEAWRRRFREEFGVDPAVGAAGVTWWSAAAGAGIDVRRGAAAPGTGIFEWEERTGAEPLADRAVPVLATRVGMAPNSWSGFMAAPRMVGARLGVPEWEAAVASGPLRVSLGRRPVGYGSGGVVMSGSGPVERLEVASAGAVRLPGVARLLGPITLNTFIGPLREARHPDTPWLWGASGGIRPHPRFRLSVHRAAMLGGGDNPTPMTARTMVPTLVGFHVGDLANQVVSVDMRWRLPTDLLLPATAYLEWGAEDSAGAWKNVPGTVAGLWLPALPGLPGVSLGGERARFAPACCGNPPWYRHRQFLGGWAADDRPLGHPLGGNGTEWAAYLDMDGLASDVRLAGRLFLRQREVENLFAHERRGNSRGFSVDAAWRPWSSVEGRVDLRGDYASGWAEQSGSVTLYVFF